MVAATRAGPAAAPPVIGHVAAYDGCSTALLWEGTADKMADLLHDGPLQAVLAARFAIDLAGAQNGPGASSRLMTEPPRTVLQAALTELRHASWWLRPRALDGDLASALEQLAAHQVRLGAPAVLVADSGGTGRVEPAAATTAYRFVQAVVEAPAAVRLSLHRDRDRAVLTVETSSVPDPELWVRRFASLGATLHLLGSGAVLELPLALELPEC